MHVGVDQPGQQHLVVGELDDLAPDQARTEGLDGDDRPVAHPDLAGHDAGRGEDAPAAEHHVEVLRTLRPRGPRALRAPVEHVVLAPVGGDEPADALGVVDALGDRARVRRLRGRLLRLRLGHRTRRGLLRDLGGSLAWVLLRHRSSVSRRSLVSRGSSVVVVVVVLVVVVVSQSWAIRVPTRASSGAAAAMLRAGSGSSSDRG